MKSKTNRITILTGRVILLNDDKALFSPVLVGNIFPDAKGKEIISVLSQIYSEKHFRKYIENFCKKDYGFFEYDEFFSVNSVKDFTSNGVINFKTLNYEATFFADWLYFKNIGSHSVKMNFKDGYEVVLEKRETIATLTGKAIPYPQKSILKTKDTISSIVLIEKTN